MLFISQVEKHYINYKHSNYDKAMIEAPFLDDTNMWPQKIID